MHSRHIALRVFGFAVLTFLAVSPAFSLDSLVFLQRYDNMRMRGLLSEYTSGEDWISDAHYNPLPLPSGSSTSLIRRFQSLDDSVLYRVNAMNGSGHRVSLGGLPITYGDFNGDSRRDYVSFDNWILLGTDSTYIGDSTGNLIVPEIVADFDGDGFDDVGHKKSQPPGSWIIWWGDSAAPLESSSLLLTPQIVPSGYITGGARAIEFSDRYDGTTIALTGSVYRWVSGLETYKREVYRVSESELIAHLDTIHTDSLLSEVDAEVAYGLGYIYHRVGDTTVLVGRNGRELIYADGLTSIVDSSAPHPLGRTAGFGMDWHQRFLPYDFDVTDSVVTLMEFVTDSMKYLHTHSFPYGHVDSGSSMLYCSMFPDVTGDGYHELAISFEGQTHEYYTNVYDVVGSIPVTSVHTPEPEGHWGQPHCRDGRLFWDDATVGECTVEIYNLTGKVIQKLSISGERARLEGVRLPEGLGTGLLLIRVVQKGSQQTFKVIGEGTSK